MENRPRARKKTVGGSGTVNVGGSGGQGGGDYSGGSGSGGTRSGGGGGLVKIAAVILALLLGGGGGYSMLNNGGGDTMSTQEVVSSGGGYSSGWTQEAPAETTPTPNETVSSSARDRFTTIKGDGKDTVTILVYMCGTDLESRSGMATSDMQEMLAASGNENVNLLVYTGGCSNWRNNVVSSKYNQIYQIAGGKLMRAVENGGKKAMTDPATLSEFIRWGAKNYPANRMALIFWDHGSGSLSGYGHDEKFSSPATMTLPNIDKAITDGGVKFDFIGFDTCLMATAETALMLSDDADYMIASEETEPGVGWYYTPWLNSLAKNTSIPTLDLGQQIVDSFVSRCQQQCRGQQATLSVTDLAELSATLPDALTTWANSTTDLIKGGNYKTVATARSSCREFAKSNALDQIDLVHFAALMDTKEGKALAKTILSAVKYNRTSSNITNAYGLSIYFPYRRLRNVDAISNTYSSIGMDDSYTRCIRSFAQMQVGGQATSPYQSSPFGSLTGGSGGGTNYGGYGSSEQAMQQLLEALLSGGYANFGRLGIEGLDETNTKFLSEDPIDVSTVMEQVSEGRITEEDLVWQKNSEGTKVIKLSEEQWAKVARGDKAFFYDTGKGYVNLGLDNLYSFDNEKNLVPDTDMDWLSVGGVTVSYFHTDTVDISDDEYSITGYVPIRLNGQTSYLFLVFDDENEGGYIAGVSYTYDKSEAVPKNLTELSEGDEIEFLADYYDYKGNHKENVSLGKVTVPEELEDLEITNFQLNGAKGKILYCFTDLFGEQYWTPVLK